MFGQVLLSKSISKVQKKMNLSDYTSHFWTQANVKGTSSVKILVLLDVLSS